MPFRSAHWWLLALAPLIPIAFWPNYYGRLAEAPLALHLHGTTAALWLVLLFVQSVAAHIWRLPLHRTLGLLSFALVPLFVAGGLAALHAMAALGLNAVTPFHAAYGARLAMLDLLSAVGFAGLVAWGLRHRRRVRAHAAAMIATALLVLPPIAARLFPMLPAFPGEGIAAFPPAFHAGNLLAAGIALWLARRGGAEAGPLAATAALLAAESALFETLAASAAWRRVLAGLVTVPVALIATGGALAALALLGAAWRAGGRRPAAQMRAVPG